MVVGGCLLCNKWFHSILVPGAWYSWDISLPVLRSVVTYKLILSLGRYIFVSWGRYDFLS